MHLVDRVKQRDQKAYKELYDQYAKPMYNLCFRFMNHHDDAHDVLQESFIKIFENIGQLNNKDLLSAWVKRICTNTAIQALKNKKRLKFDELDDHPTMINLQDEDEIIHEEEYEQNIHVIHQAIQMLPDRYRVVFTMHVLEDYSHEEISKMLGIVSGTSRSQYLRAKQRLIELIKKKNTMSDKLKKFIQRSKTEFDQESPRPDLFDKIMDNVDHNKIGTKPTVKIKYAFQWIAVAASLILLIVCSLFFYLSDNKIQNPTFQITETPVILKDDNLSHQGEVAQTSTSDQIHEDATNTEMISSNSMAFHKTKINSTPSVKKKLVENLQSENFISSIESTSVHQTVADTKNTESSTIPVNNQSSTEDIIAENIAQQENKPSDLIIVSSIPEVTKTEDSNQIKEFEKTTVPSNDSKTETIANEDIEESPSLQSTIKKGFFKFISKKARKWSGNTLSIRNIETNDRSVLAVRYKDERVEFSKSFNLGPSN